ncbi:hypothetical protein K439DRAFT_207543 [Ramaria rubella]|nr:hypothetical protein K439DRAFT_207543 [Ramaria rubella]
MHLFEGVRLATLAHDVHAEDLPLARAPCPDRGPEYACENKLRSGSVKACWRRSLRRSRKRRESRARSSMGTTRGRSVGWIESDWMGARTVVDHATTMMMTMHVADDGGDLMELVDGADADEMEQMVSESWHVLHKTHGLLKGTSSKPVESLPCVY